MLRPTPADVELLTLVHDPAYLEAVKRAPVDPGVGQAHREIEPDRVQGVLAAHRVTEQGLVPDHGHRVAHGPSSLGAARPRRRYPPARVAHAAQTIRSWQGFPGPSSVECVFDTEEYL